jgi:hypothetical protein
MVPAVSREILPEFMVRLGGGPSLNRSFISDRNTLNPVLGCFTWAYWGAFYALVFLDASLSWPAVMLLLKLLFPIVTALNVAGMIMGLFALRAERNAAAIWSLCLHGFPLVAAAWFVWWLFFGVAI